MQSGSEISAIHALADAERRDWFVWDCLAKAAYEWSGYDRSAAVALLRQAIAELASRDPSRLPEPMV